MDHIVDTAIIGAGPAGTACGIRLLEGGVSCLIVEKRSFPRDKVCGGLVTEKTHGLLCSLLAPDGDLSPDLFCDTSDRAELWYKNERLAAARVSKPFRLVRRVRLDAKLAERYRELGGTLLENSECAAIDAASRRLTLKNGDTVSFRHLVAADGALSVTRKALGFETPSLGFCAETHVKKPAGRENGAVQIHFGIVKKGYAWVFPSGDDLCVGLGGCYEKGVRYDALLREYLALNGLEADRPTKGAFVPYGDLVEQRGGADFAALVGDAGGFVDPLTGEGLYFALSTGIAAADAVIRSAAGAGFKTEFLRSVAPFGKIVTQGKRTQSVFFSSVEKSAFRKKFAGKDAFVAYYCDNQLSEYNYPYAKIWEIGLDYKRSRK